MWCELLVGLAIILHVIFDRQIVVTSGCGKTIKPSKLTPLHLLLSDHPRYDVWTLASAANQNSFAILFSGHTRSNAVVVISEG